MRRMIIIVAFAAFVVPGCTDSSAGNPVGTEGGDCYPNSSCNTGLACYSNLCVRPGDAGGAPDGQGSDRFSFFITSLQAMQTLSGSQDGFGGDLGGLSGADQICQKTAATVGGSAKTWRAFLSVSKGPDGTVVNAIDRIGQGPWYDRNGRLVASTIQGLLSARPGGDPQIIDDLPDEQGRGLKQFGDNHDVLTGSNAKGQLASADPATTCMDWTSAVASGSEMKVMCGHAWPRTGGGIKVRPDGGLPPKPDGGPPGPPDGGTKGGSDGGKAPSGGDATHWIMAHPVPGCAPGVNLIQTGGGQGSGTVGGGGGYGGIYCFALTP
jgi:hypothetical protein